MRIGFGYDIHRLVPGGRLILGGIAISYPYGLKGHSDGDAVVHAVIDAVMGAAQLGDIGRLFPDTDPQYEGMSSLIMLEKVAGILKKKKKKIVNVDCTI